MLKLSLSPQVEQFRAELRVWLAANPPPRTSSDASLETFQTEGRAWQARLAAGRWLGVHWAKEYGGRGLSLVEEAVVQEELVRVRSPQILGLFGLTMVGPVLIQHGTDAQKRRFLSNILEAKEIWCQGFSEPGAGSDLAAVKTKAIPVEGGYRISGHKIWTSFAHVADWCFMLCRTSDGGAKHKGLSYLLVPMRQPGISTRPLKQISGEEEFNEVFIDDVFVPSENLVGAEGEGWKIALSTLMYERVVLTFARQLQSEVLLRTMLDAGASEITPAELSEQVIRACAVRALSYEHLVEYAGGKPPGPEGSLDKLYWSESFQAIAKLAFRATGTAGALSERNPDSGAEVLRYLYSRGRTIAAGTSEIQRNIIAERLLGLPRSGK